MSKKLNCNFEYLKPISYDDLFDDRCKNKCSDYSLVLEKLGEARNAFFGFQAAIFNFVKDCTILQQKIRNDISGNDLDSLQYEYIILVNNLIASTAISLRKRMESDHLILINFEVPSTTPGKTIKDFTQLQATNIILSDSGHSIETLVTTIPSVCLYLTDNFTLEVKIIMPRSVSYGSLSTGTYVKNLRCKTNDIFTRTMLPGLPIINNMQQIYSFPSNDAAYDFFEDIVNYDVDGNISGHQLKDVVERIDSIILGIENTHRTIIQKIKTEQYGTKYEQDHCKKNSHEDSESYCKKSSKELHRDHHRDHYRDHHRDHHRDNHTENYRDHYRDNHRDNHRDFYN